MYERKGLEFSPFLSFIVSVFVVAASSLVFTILYHWLSSKRAGQGETLGSYIVCSRSA